MNDNSPVAKPGFRLRPSLDWLLIFVPISIALRFVPGLRNDTALFITSCLAIIPLAGWMGRATEHLADQVGQGIGGLLNATFGNAAELIIALMALSKGLTGVVKASITGSIIGNVLLVLGLSFVAGGSKYREQTFNRTAASVSTTALALAAVALVIPTIFHIVAAPTDARWQAKEQDMSVAIAVVLFLTYGASLYFSLKTHKELFIGGCEGVADEADAAHHEQWSRRKSVAVLLVATMFVALISEFLVGAVENARASLGLTEVFVGVIVVAIIGNAAEHSSAVLMAMRNKMDLALGIAVGSSLQIALFVAPVLIFASYLFGRPMNLEFTIPEVVAVVGAVFIVGQISQDGESNWLEGVQLLCLYAILGILFYFLPEAHHAADAAPAVGAVPGVGAAHGVGAAPGVGGATAGTALAPAH
ncbi:MAG TPA: calcium/proton exchanger [Abditibacteriaceae bacterium]|jgi:Ca2+:H+ antiporter